MAKKLHSPVKLILSIVFTLFAFINVAAEETNRTVISRWTGTFRSAFHGQGQIRDWTLYSDGTFRASGTKGTEGSLVWLAGTYSLKDGVIIFSAEWIPPAERSRKTPLRLSGGGRLGSERGKGFFTLYSAKDSSAADYGMWEVKAGNKYIPLRQ